MSFYPNSKTGIVYIFAIGNIQSFTSQTFGVVGPKNLDFLIRWDLTFKQILIKSPLKIKLYLIGALKRYLNKKNLINGRIMATILKFSPQIFETYFGSLFVWLSFVLVCPRQSKTKMAKMYLGKEVLRCEFFKSKQNSLGKLFLLVFSESHVTNLQVCLKIEL